MINSHDYRATESCSTLTPQINMVELSWSQTPSSVWWALETGSAPSNLSLDNILSAPTPTKTAGKRSLLRQITSPTVFYNSLDETDSASEQEKDLEQWVAEDPNRGIIRLAHNEYATRGECLNLCKEHSIVKVV